ncbi:hypothetical protein Acr_00g0056730 [Actinidia rufa]|uniref:Uncharacterized protein n=1 Tax=Actinidia rufa TaxID=165716 RepID=A0A7J0DPC1_9ERIC|nr:hypothetical protein Acr_00g0056730 [Actinidia rufa]
MPKNKKPIPTKAKKQGSCFENATTKHGEEYLGEKFGFENLCDIAPDHLDDFGTLRGVDLAL